MKKFAIIGVGGYIAPRHLKAIKDVGGKLVAACDEKDSVGQLDSHSYDVEFFTDDRAFADFLKSSKVDVLVVCSPNYLHVTHAIMGLEAGADVICEKPLALTEDELNRLQEAERKSGKRIGTILQLRVHPSLVAIQQDLIALGKQDHVVRMKYVTSRGPWYHRSWKGDVSKSGGLATNIGVHLFDLLVWFFGENGKVTVTEATPHIVAGKLQFDRASVDWMLSVDNYLVPEDHRKAGKNTYRSITVDGTEVEFSEGFNDLHTVIYRHFLQGKVFGINDVRPGIKIVEEIRRQAKALQ